MLRMMLSVALAGAQDETAPEPIMGIPRSNVPGIHATVRIRTEDDEQHEIEGEITTYTLEFGRPKPSMRSITFKNRVTGLLNGR